MVSIVGASPGPDGVAEPESIIAGEVPAVGLLALDLVLAGVMDFLTVPGHPGTALSEELGLLGARVNDAHNEKVAAEIAFGYSIAGAPVGVIMKGNGALLAAEPLQNAGPHGVGAPLLLIVGDDVRASSSTVPTDARSLGDTLGVPVFDVPTGRHRRATVVAAVRASGDLRRPVIVRFTEAMVRSMEVPEPPTLASPASATKWSATTGFVHTKLSRYLRFAIVEAPAVQRIADAAPMVRMDGGTRPGPERVGVLAAGATWELLVDWQQRLPRWTAMGVTCIAPLPTYVVEYCRFLDRVVVLEEGRPVLEDGLQLALARAGVSCRVDGQRNGLVKPLGPTTSAEVASAMRRQTVAVPEPEVRPMALHPERHPYARLFDALTAVQQRCGVQVETCVGSCISAAYDPWGIVETALNLGGSTGVAAGVAAVTGRPVIALIGDYGLIHSGMSALDQISQRGLPVLTIVLDNGVSAKTGGQPSAVSPGVSGVALLDLHDLLMRGAPQRTVHRLSLREVDEADLEVAIETLLDQLPAVLLVADT